MPSTKLSNFSILLILTIVGCASRPAPVSTAPANAGLLVVAHGANLEWNDQVRGAVARVRWNGPVSVAFLMGEEAESAGWDSAVTRLEAAGAPALVVVPLMVSSNGGHYEQVRYYAGVRDSMPGGLGAHAHHAPRRPSVPVRVTAALDGAPEMAQAVAERWSSLGAAHRARPVVLVGHGPGDEASTRRWMEQFREVEMALARAGLRADVRSGLLQDDAPAPVRAAAIAALRDTVRALSSRSGDSVVALTVVIARGSITRVTVPRDLEGLPVEPMAAAMSGSPVIARWIERVAAPTFRR